jgi:hypothetical protein
MKKYTYVVLTRPVAGKENEYNDWYDNRHLADVVAVPGFTGAKRYRAASEVSGIGDPQMPYLALYNIETDDLQGTLDAMTARSGTDAMPISDALDTSSVYAVIYEAVDG